MSKLTDFLKVALRKFGEFCFFLSGLLLVVGVGGLSILAPYLLGRSLLQWTQSALPIVAHGFVLLTFFIVLGVWAWMISGDRGNQLFRSLYQHGIKWPFLFSIALLFFALLCFASLSSTLNDLGLICFEPAIAPGEFWRFQDFYAWHFLDSIPGLKVPATLQWEQPYNYTDTLSGVLLLSFKLLVIIPVIGSFTVWTRVRKEAKQGGQNSGLGI